MGHWFPIVVRIAVSPAYPATTVQQRPAAQTVSTSLVLLSDVSLGHVFNIPAGQKAANEAICPAGHAWGLVVEYCFEDPEMWAYGELRLVSLGYTRTNHPLSIRRNSACWTAPEP